MKFKDLYVYAIWLCAAIFDVPNFYYILKAPPGEFFGLAPFQQGNPSFLTHSRPLWLLGHLGIGLLLLFISGRYVLEQSQQLKEDLALLHCGFVILVLFNANHLLFLTSMLATITNVGILIFLTAFVIRHNWFCYFAVLSLVPLAGAGAFIRWSCQAHA